MTGMTREQQNELTRKLADPDTGKLPNEIKNQLDPADTALEARDQAIQEALHGENTEVEAGNIGPVDTEEEVRKNNITP